MMSERPQEFDPQEDARYEVFVKKFAHHEGDLRRFARSLLPNWTDADEVVQQTAIVMWRKFEQYDPETNFMKWGCVIARFEALAYRRKMARDRLVFREDVLELMADEGIEEMDQRDAEHAALESCLEEVPEMQRRFLTLAHTQGVNVKELAEQAGSTAAAFYMRLNRLRRQLMKCVESKLQQPDPA
jgi:RNA polymerase sigma-70 factor (ECF subfamily)